MLNSLCRIQVVQSDGIGGLGCGVFVTPKRIMTAFHVVQGAKSVTIINPDGIRTGMKRRKDGGRHFFDADLDVAMIELAAPIAKDFAHAAGNSYIAGCKRDFTRQVKGYIGTMQSGKPALHEMFIDPIQQLQEASRKKSMVSFHCTEKVVPGWSGSPIFAEDGFSLLSIVSAHQPVIQDKAIAMNQAFKHVLKAGIPLLAPHPQKFDEWTQKVERELGHR